jgi:hypothetical protein
MIRETFDFATILHWSSSGKIKMTLLNVRSLCNLKNWRPNVQKDGILQTATKQNDYVQKQKELFYLVEE